MSRRAVRILAQIVVLGAGAWFLLRTARASAPALTRFDLVPEPLPLVAASLLTAGTWAFLVAVWVRSLGWWHPPQHLSYRQAVRIWFVSNLARYIPGTVWQFAGLAAMVAEQGISPVAATGAVLLQQVVLLVTGVAVTLVFAPQLATAWGASLAPTAIWGLAAAVAVVAAAAMPAMGRLARRVLTRFTRREVPWPEPEPRALAAYVAGLLLPWLAYGVAFWWFGRAVLGNAAPGLGLAAGAFVTSYVAGIIAVFAPGGIVVREAALVAALTPVTGADAALFLAVGSRLWLTALEIVTALLAMVWGREASVPSNP